MSTHSGRFAASRDAAAGTSTSALSHYLTAVARSGGWRPTTDYTLRDERSWKLGHVPVRDIMGRVRTPVRANARFGEIVDLLAGQQVDLLPVVGSDNRVLGVVSESDLLAAVIADSEATPNASTPATESTALLLMRSPAVTTRANVSVAHAARTAALAHVRQLPVVDDNGRLLGIVALTDLLRVILRTEGTGSAARRRPAR